MSRPVYKLPIALLKLVKDYAKVRATQRRHESEGRAAKKTADMQQATLLKEMGTALVATCGNCVVSIRTTNAVVANIKLSNGKVIDFRDVLTFIYKDPDTGQNRTVARGQIESIYGGRKESICLEVSGE